jgi:hypothetical protein
MKTVVVTYSVKPERRSEHVQLIAAVFDELRAATPPELHYRVLALADGVSFVHIATHDDQTNPLTGLPAFVAFTQNIADRVVAPPVSSAAETIGSYAATSGQ